MEVHKQMEIKVQEAFLELQTMQMEQSAIIDKDRLEVEGMIKELDLAKVENEQAEKEQATVMESLSFVQRDVYEACRELHDVRMQYNSLDM